MSARLSIGVVALVALARVAIAGLRRLSPDEAYYLCAARAPSAPWPIPDHPPAVGALVALADRAAPGAIELRVRVVAILCQAATALAIGALAAICAEPRARDRAFGWGALLATLGLMPWVSGLITTPDAPLLAACAWLLVFAADAKVRPRPGTHAALLALAALAVASKVVALAVVAAVVFDLARARRARGAIAAGAGAAIALPLAWPSLELQVAHALGRGPLVSAPHLGAPLALAAAVTGAFALFGPAVVVLAARGRARVPALVGGPFIVLGLGAAFVASALVSGRPPEPNWIAPAMLPAFAVAGAVTAEVLGPRGRAIAVVVHVVPALVAVGLWLAPGLPRGPRDPLARVPRVDTGAEGLRAATTAELPAYARPAWSCAYEDIALIPNTSKLTFQAPPQASARP